MSAFRIRFSVRRERKVVLIPLAVGDRHDLCSEFLLGLSIVEIDTKAMQTIESF
jgi:hypothetical protein